MAAQILSKARQIELRLERKRLACMLAAQISSNERQAKAPNWQHKY
jgi:hypothetical protein